MLDEERMRTITYYCHRCNDVHTEDELDLMILEGKPITYEEVVAEFEQNGQPYATGLSKLDLKRSHVKSTYFLFRMLKHAHGSLQAILLKGEFNA